MKHFLFLTFVFCTSFGHAQDWLESFKKSQAHYESAEMELAISEGNKALNLFETAYSTRQHSNYCVILHQLVTYSFEVGQLEQGKQFAEEEIDILSQLGGSENVDIAEAYYNHAAISQELDDFQAAEESYRQVLKLYEENGMDSYSIADVQGNLATVLYLARKLDEADLFFTKAMQEFSLYEERDESYLYLAFNYGSYCIEANRFDEAIIHLGDVVKMLVSIDQTETTIYADALSALGASYQEIGDYDNAAKRFVEASQVYELLYGEADESFLNTVNALALIYQKQGKSSEASELLEKIGVSTVSEGTEFAISMSNAAAIQQNEGNYDQAEEYYQKSLGAFNKQSDLDQYYITLENFGLMYLTISNFGKAQGILNEVKEIANTFYGDSSEQYGKILTYFGDLYRLSGKVGQAEQNYGQAKKILSSNPGIESLVYAKALSGEAAMQQELGNYNDANLLYRDVLSIIENKVGRDHPDFVIAFNNLAITSQAAGNYVNAERLFQSVILRVEATKGKSHPDYGIAVKNLAKLYLDQGKYDQALSHFENSMVVIEKSFGTNHPEYAGVLISLGSLNKIQGNYEKAEPLFIRALEIYKITRGEDHPDYANALNNMAILYETMGNFAAAEPLLVQAVSIFEAAFGKNHLEYATSLENLATLFQTMGQYQRAEPLLKEALEIDERVLGTTHPKYAVTLHNLASLYQDTENYVEAEALFKQAIEIDKRIFGENHQSYASSMYNLAVLLADLDRFEDSETLFKQVIEIRRNTLGEKHPEYAFSIYGLAVLYQKMGNDEGAMTLYNESINSYLERIATYFPSLSEKEKSALYSKIQPVFESFKEFAVEYVVNSEGSPASKDKVLSELYNVQLSTKALLLNASNKVRGRILNSGDQGLIDSYNEWISLKERLVRYYSYSLEQLKKEGVSISEVEQKSNTLEKALSSKSELFASELESKRYYWEDVRDALSDNDAAVEILRIKRNSEVDSTMYIGLVIRKSHQTPELVVFNKGTSLDIRLFNYYKNSIKFKFQDLRSYQNFWQQIDERIEGVDNVYLSSDGIFNKVNVNSLLNPKSNKYVVENYNVRLLSNTRELTETRGAGNTSNTAEIFGYPNYKFGANNVNDDTIGGAFSSMTRSSFKNGISDLIGTKGEVETLEKLMETNGWQYSSYLQDEASEESIKSIQGPRLLHIATHGFFLTDLDVDEDADAFGIHLNNFQSNPLFRSGLLLKGASKTIYGTAPSSGEDGILTAYEAMNLHLDQTELIVLSACETGLGEIKNGEGVYGLQRSFMVAGARNLIMSLWSVNDETTKKLMTSFYGHWLGGDDKFLAFSKAQLELKEEFKDPYYWGAFVLLGK